MQIASFHAVTPSLCVSFTAHRYCTVAVRPVGGEMVLDVLLPNAKAPPSYGETRARSSKSVLGAQALPPEAQFVVPVPTAELPDLM